MRKVSGSRPAGVQGIKKEPGKYRGVNKNGARGRRESAKRRND